MKKKVRNKSAQTVKPARGFGESLPLALLAIAVYGGVCFWFLPKYALATLALSVGLFALYAYDKRAAENGRFRIAEKQLHLWAALGGWPGALLARPLLRHKTQKLPFIYLFYCTILLNVAGVAYVVWQGRLPVSLHSLMK